MSLYLSRLTLNARHNRTKSEVERPYELHRTICNAWHDPKADRILFRPEQDGPNVVTVIVQSRTEPDWLRLKVPTDYLLQADGPKPVDLQRLTVDQCLQFRLRCFPSKRVGAKDREDTGKRRGLTTKDEMFGWLHRKAEGDERSNNKGGGFKVREAVFDRLYWYDSKGGIQDKALGAVRFDGILVVTDPDHFRAAVANGIGSGKAFGFGLLSVAPLRE